MEVQHKLKQIALLGNPNVGKSSLFNALTGLNQKVGNFPGVTVDKKIGICQLSEQHKIELTDLPGIYSLFAKSPDERVVLEILLNKSEEQHPELLLLVLDAVNIERSLMLYTQACDLGYEVLPLLSMSDVAEAQGISIDIKILETALQRPVFRVNARNNEGIKELKAALGNFIPKGKKYTSDFEEKLLQTQFEYLQFLSPKQKNIYSKTLADSGKDVTDLQLEDTFARMNQVHELLAEVLEITKKSKSNFTDKVDKLIAHPVAGYFIYFGILLLIFQIIFSVAEYPMNWIDGGISALNAWLKGVLPASALTDLLTEGLVAGIGGVLIFIPQIALLFGIIAILEESGYMSRVVYLMDRPMRMFGLNGKSVVPLISGAACAVPAIMSARGIDAWKERLITIFVTPFISCAARLPVYVIIIALVIPEGAFLGFSYKGLTLLGLYILGIFGALLTAMAMSKILKTKERALFVIDLPSYKTPRWKNVGTTIYQKTKTFVLEAGKIILAISVILWALASYGAPNSMKNAALKAAEIVKENPELNLEEVTAAQKLEASFIGQFGQFIEPVIHPLGYDWKIGIALITSFAAREVFVGTLGTIYSVGEENFEERLVDRMRKETFADSGKPVYTFASGLSLLVFYVFAMQCMSTVAVVYRETGGWKWPLIQLFYMSGLAYLLALLTFFLLN